MKINSLSLVFFIAICSTLSAQKNNLIINPDIVMPKDSLEGIVLMVSVNAFLACAVENSENKWILPSDRIETQLLIDELIDIQKSEEFKNDSFYKGYLTKITALEDNSYAVHIAYLGVNEQSPVLRANFELIAHKNDDSFLISSPLKRNTRNWQTKKFPHHTFHYPYTVNLEKIKQFSELAGFYDDKLENNVREAHYYLCENEMDPLKLFGVEYKSDYNGWELNSSWESSIEKNDLFVLNGADFYGFDTHDLWHNRLSQVISRRKVHRRVDCHIGCLHGGSWGKSWEELFTLFNEKFVVGDKVDWLKHKEEYSNFKTDGHKNYTDDFIGALLIRKIENEKGFDGVWKLLKTKRNKAEDEYFAALEELVGISKKNYNKEAYKLIKEELKNQGLKFNAN